jgi:hypothetical protein
MVIFKVMLQKVENKIVGVQSRTECRPWNVRAQRKNATPIPTATQGITQREETLDLPYLTLYYVTI